MQRTIHVAERCVFTDPPNVITVAASTPTILLQDEQFRQTGEIAQRYIQNTGANNLYYSFGLLNRINDFVPLTASCDNLLNYHGVLLVNEQLDCSAERRVVCGYSVGGTTVATIIQRRKDLSN